MRSDGGFSLVEAMFAMLLLMTVAVGAYGMQGGGLFDMLDSGDKSGVAQQQRAVAAQIAEGEMDRLRGLSVATTESRVVNRSGFRFKLANSLQPATEAGSIRAATCDSDAFKVRGSTQWQAQVAVSLESNNNLSDDDTWADGNQDPVELDGTIRGTDDNVEFTDGYLLVYVQGADGNGVDGANVVVPGGTPASQISQASQKCLLFAVPPTPSGGPNPQVTVTAPPGMVIDEKYHSTDGPDDNEVSVQASQPVTVGNKVSATVHLRSGNRQALSIGFRTKKRPVNQNDPIQTVSVRPDSFMLKQGSGAPSNISLAHQEGTDDQTGWKDEIFAWDAEHASAFNIVTWPLPTASYQAWAGSESTAMAGAATSFPFDANQTTASNIAVNVPSVDVRVMSGLSSAAPGVGVADASVRLYVDANNNKKWDTGETYWDRKTDANGLLTDPSVATSHTTLSACVFSTQPQKLVGVTKWNLSQAVAATILSPIMIVLVSARDIINNVIHLNLPGAVGGVFTAIGNVLQFVVQTIIPTFIAGIETIVKNLLNPVQLISYLLGITKTTLTKSLGSFNMPSWVNLPSVPVAVAAPGARQTALVGLANETVEFPPPAYVGLGPVAVPVEDPVAYYEKITASVADGIQSSSTPCM